ncbi:hypothetical protein DPMN_153211 [Dreissena polymorpha]|uniref:Uncharacterized protein n=1 Tax=Dreissena polymorpha TaxID=45954 RepID=A0A9D4FIX5_DREPO|nr:hypothetical protein DPMN_153211 [Dreissena polymorpha]
MNPYSVTCFENPTIGCQVIMAFSILLFLFQVDPSKRVDFFKLLTKLFHVVICGLQNSVARVLRWKTDECLDR